MTFSTASGATPARCTAARTATAPRSVALRGARAPRNFPTGVRAGGDDHHVIRLQRAGWLVCHGYACSFLKTAYRPVGMA